MGTGTGKKIAIAAAATAAVVAACVVLFGGRAPVPETVEVHRGPFEFFLQTDGDLEAVEKQSITSPFNGEVMRLLHVGERVEAGEAVLQMDTERLDNEIESSESQLRELEANRVKVEESVSKQLNSAGLAIRRAEIELRLAKLRNEEVQAGPGEEDLLDAQRALKSARIVAANRAEELSILELLEKKGFVTGEEIQSKRLELLQAASQLEKAEASHSTVVAGSSQSARKDAALKLRIAEIELERARKHLDSLKEITKAQLEKAKIAEERQKRNLNEARENIEKAEVTAPIAGIVQLETRHRRRHGRRWRQGDWAWERAKIMSIPSLARMKLTGKIDENEIPLVQEGQEVRARIPYAPGRVFKGSVVRTAPLGKDAHADFGARTKEKIGDAERQVFDVDIELDETDQQLLPGLRVHAEIVVYRKAAALFVPVSAVRCRDGDCLVGVWDGRSVSERPVTAGRRNATHVEITSGISEGDRVVIQGE